MLSQPVQYRSQEPDEGVEPVVATQELSKRYGRVEAVSGVQLDVGRGQIYGFLGPNGAGKTTTIRMLLGLVRPTGGGVKLFGRPLVSNRAALLGRVGALVESPSAYPNLTGRRNLEVTRRLLDAPRDSVARVLKEVGLAEAADRRVATYSLGMKGRLGLAMALVGDPELLILDEPTNGLDPAGIRWMRSFIRSLPDRGVTVLMSSHQLAEVEQVASHVGIIAGGRLRFQGSLEELRARAKPRVMLEVNDQEGALSFLKKHYPSASGLDGKIMVPVPPGEPAVLARQLMEAGYQIIGVNAAAAGLEELFMGMIDGPEEVG